MNRKFFLLLGILFPLAGCVDSASPQFFRGSYYMTGDRACKRFNYLNPGYIMCFDLKGNETGYREAMTDQQLMMYRYNQQMQLNELNNISAQTRAMANQINTQTHYYSIENEMRNQSMMINNYVNSINRSW